MITRLAVLFLLLAQSATATAEPLTIAVDTSAPPFMYSTSSGKPAGLYPALAKEAFGRLGMQVDIVAMPWRIALAEAKAGRTGIAGAYKTREREECLAFSDPIYMETLLAVTLRGSEFRLGGIQSLKGKRVGVIRGWSYGNGFDAARASGEFDAEESDSDAQNLQKLMSRRIDVMIAIREGSDACIALSPRPAAFTVLRPPLSETATHVALPKTPENQAILKRFNAALASMRQDGTWDMIVMGILARP